ncbi:MAG: hypothetical protein PVF83_08655 [Anaerolineales bacterium]
MTGVGPPPTGDGQPLQDGAELTSVGQVTGVGPPPTGDGQPLPDGAELTSVGHVTGVGPPPTGDGQPLPDGAELTSVGQVTGVGPPPTGEGHPPTGRADVGVGITGIPAGSPETMVLPLGSHPKTAGLAGSRITRKSPCEFRPTTSASCPGLSVPRSL